MKINRNFDNLVPNYLFADVAKKTNAYIAAHPDKKVIKLGIGDVTLPLAPVVVEAMKKGAEDLAHKETFKGYPDYEGYEFLRQAMLCCCFVQLRIAKVNPILLLSTCSTYYQL